MWLDLKRKDFTTTSLNLNHVTQVDFRDDALTGLNVQTGSKLRFRVCEFKQVFSHKRHPLAVRQFANRVEETNEPIS